MTVCVGLKVHDGIVFAADNASTLIGTYPDGSSGVINVWQHGNKVFNLRKHLPIIAMTCGMGHIGHASISALAKDFRLLLTSGDDPLDENNYTIKEVVERAHTFFGDAYNALDPLPNPPHSFEFWIGGMDSGDMHGEVWKIQTTDQHVFDPVEIVAKDCPDQVFWGGQPSVINRLLMGYDNNLIEVLSETESDDAAQGAFISELQSRAATPLVHAAMPIQDAIKLADFLVETTKRYFAFLPGADVVGGDTDIATVTKHEHFKWIRRKHYYPANLNTLETDHA